MNRFLIGLMSLALFVSQARAEKSKTPDPVTVTNTSFQPVPVVTQGTSTITGNVVVTNSTVPINGTVNVTNTSLPVTGAVDVNNLPLDSSGNVKVTAVQQTLKYEFKYVIFQVCETTPTERNLCNGTNGEQEASTTLTNLSSQGWELWNQSTISRTPSWANSSPSWREADVIFMFRRQVQ